MSKEIKKKPVATARPAAWLMKSEPDAFSIEDLARVKRSRWDGVRNYQARNFMMNEMRVGDTVLFYHSNATPSAVVGLARVSAPAAPDASAQDPKSDYFDAKAAPDKPIWYCVEVEFVRAFARPLALEEIRGEKALAKMALVQKGQRLSIQPVTKEELAVILRLGSSPA